MARGVKGTQSMDIGDFRVLCVRLGGVAVSIPDQPCELRLRRWRVLASFFKSFRVSSLTLVYFVYVCACTRIHSVA